jgi:hypothetical protein
VMLHVFKRLDLPTLSPSLVMLTQSQMLIQREYLLKKKMHKNRQILHMGKGQRLTSKLWHHQMLLSAMSLINSLALILTNLPVCHVIDLALAAAGSTRSGEEFFETFAPVAKIESICMLLAVAAILDWEIHVIDVDSAILNGKMPKAQTV